MVEKHYKDKAALVAQLRDELERASAVVVTEYRGLKAGDLVKLRGGLRESNVKLRVVKNSLLRRAAEGMPLAEMLGDLAGPTAVALGFGEPVDAAKVLSKGSTTLEAFNLKAGYIEKMVVDAGGITAIAKLPGKSEMHAQFAGVLEGFVAEFVGLAESLVREFHGLLEAKIEKDSA
jgi:large subunit ribosomal protein L10